MVQEYFDQLFKLFREIEVTNQAGNPKKLRQTFSLDEGISKAVQLIKDAPKVILIGNGGSAAIASHIQNDLCAGGKRAMVFTEQPLLTALSNDRGYETVFPQLLGLWLESGDVLWSISSSGESRNIVQCLHARDCRKITFSGFAPSNRCRSLGDLNFYVPSSSYAEVESVHTALAHFITTEVRKE